MELKADDTGAAIVPVLACVLNQLCDRNDHHPDNLKIHPSKFHALRPPAITIKDYLLRIAKYAACSGECFVLALVYIDRIIQSNPTFVVNSLNIHRLLITSVMLAAKFFDDQYFNNAYYAKVGGVPRGEMNSLEVEFLFMTNFTLFVPTEQYRQYYTELCNHAKNNACECNQQDGKIPSLAIPIADAGSIPFNPPITCPEEGYATETASSSIAPAHVIANKGAGHGAATGAASAPPGPGQTPTMMTDSPAQAVQAFKYNPSSRAQQAGASQPPEEGEQQATSGPSAMAF